MAPRYNDDNDESRGRPDLSSSRSGVGGTTPVSVAGRVRDDRSNSPFLGTSRQPHRSRSSDGEQRGQTGGQRSSSRRPPLRRQTVEFDILPPPNWLASSNPNTRRSLEHATYGSGQSTTSYTSPSLGTQSSEFASVPARSNTWGVSSSSSTSLSQSFADNPSALSGTAPRSQPAQPGKHGSRWDSKEDGKIWHFRVDKRYDWEGVARELPGRSADTCQSHFLRYLEKEGRPDQEPGAALPPPALHSIRRGDWARKESGEAWTKEEDNKLMECKGIDFPLTWAEIANYLPRRAPKSCEMRYSNYLKGRARFSKKATTGRSQLLRSILPASKGPSKFDESRRDRSDNDGPGGSSATGLMPMPVK